MLPKTYKLPTVHITNCAVYTMSWWKGTFLLFCSSLNSVTLVNGCMDRFLPALHACSEPSNAVTHCLYNKFLSSF